MRSDTFLWIMQRCRFKPRTVEILDLIWNEGLSRPGVGRLLGIRTSTVQKLEGRAKHKMLQVFRESDPGEQALWQAMLEREEDESLPLDRRGHVTALLQAMHGPRKYRPEAPEYDERGRPIARRDPLVTVDEAIYAIMKAEQERGLSGKVKPLWQATYG